MGIHQVHRDAGGTKISDPLMPALVLLPMLVGKGGSNARSARYRISASLRKRGGKCMARQDPRLGHADRIDREV